MKYGRRNSAASINYSDSDDYDGECEEGGYKSKKSKRSKKMAYKGKKKGLSSGSKASYL